MSSAIPTFAILLVLSMMAYVACPLYRTQIGLVALMCLFILFIETQRPGA